MLIGLHDSDKENRKRKIFPNLALMKISAYHKARGDDVEWWQETEEYDTVYSSKIFDYTPENPLLPADTIKGGTGYRDIPLNQTLPSEIDSVFPDYSIYPSCDFAVGYLTRGCPRSCRWCVVHQKEGDIAPYKKWQEVVRDDTPKLTLLDNNILACQHGISQLEELATTNFRVDLNQGMDVRLVTKEVAKVLATVKWQRYMRFACDQTAQIDDILRVTEIFRELGVKPYRIFLYVLVTEDVNNASQRVEALKHLKGINFFAQPERNDSLGIVPNKEQKEFALRFMGGRCYKKETWQEYQVRRGFNFE